MATTHDTIRPKNGADFAVVEEADVKGGYRSVADTAARDAITVPHRTAGMLVKTLDTGNTWSLEGDLTTWEPQGTVIDGVIVEGTQLATTSGYASIGARNFDASLLVGRVLTFSAILHVSELGRIGYARLFCTTDQSTIVEINNSLAPDVTLPTEIVSGTIVLTGSKMYEVHIKIDLEGSEVVLCQRASIVIT